jgi:8-oxo-dGTP diphosphatase
MNNNNAPRVGVGILITNGDEVLLMKRVNAHGAGTWSTPGGHLDFGESPLDCAEREAHEETGVSVRNIRFKGFTNDLFVAEDKHYVTLWMVAEYASGKARVNAAYEATDVAWFRWNDLPSPLFLPLQNLLDGKCHTPQG